MSVVRPKKIVVLGTTGSGKTTLAKRLSSDLKYPYIELDAFMWEPGWVSSSPEVFRERIEKAIDQSTWVLDGNYSEARQVIWGQADIAIWLDLPFFTIFKQLIKRTYANCRSQKELWPGCRETFRMQLCSRKTILYWFFRSYWKKKRTFPRALASFPNLTVIHVQSLKQLPEKVYNRLLEDDGGLEFADAPDRDVCCEKADR